jgi:hypothetical protein
MTKCGAGRENASNFGNEPLICNQRVGGSNPPVGSNSKALTNPSCAVLHIEPLLEDIRSSHSEEQLRSTAA